MKNKLWIPIVLILAAIAAAAAIYFLHYDEDDAREMIIDYMYCRYDDVSYSNFDESIEKQSDFYSEKLKNTRNWVNDKENVEAGKEYYHETGFVSKVEKYSLSKIKNNLYEAEMYVLYSNIDNVGTNEVKYIYRFTLCHDINNFGSYLFDDIDILMNVVTYLDVDQDHVHEDDHMHEDEHVHH